VGSASRNSRRCPSPFLSVNSVASSFPLLNRLRRLVSLSEESGDERLRDTRVEAFVPADRSAEGLHVASQAVVLLQAERVDRGEIVDVRVPPVVMVRYDRGGALAVQLVQAKSPAVSLPNGLDLRALGEIGLRVLGLPSVEAREFAAAIDWQTTMIVPLPANASSFKQVNINGHPGVSIERSSRLPNGNSRFSTLLLWSGDGMVFGLDAPGLSSADSLRMAESLR